MSNLTWITPQNRQCVLGVGGGGETQSVSILTPVAEQLGQQRVRRGDHCRGLGRQLVEQSGYGGHSAALSRAKPRCRGETEQVTRQRHSAHHLNGKHKCVRSVSQIKICKGGTRAAQHIY